MHALAITDLTKVYANGVKALNGVSLTVDQGDFFALLGPNGAGKSTTIGIVASLVTKTAGTVKVFGVDIDRNFPLAKSYIGLVPQEINFNQFERVIDIVVHQAGYYGIDARAAVARAEPVLSALGLWDRREEISRNLSGGMKRRLMIARALIHGPRLLILDEPTAGVDIEIRRATWDFLTDLNAAGTTIILTTHYLEEAEQLCRHIAIIDHGETCENTTMKKLLAKLHAEVFVLDLTTPLETAPAEGEFGARLVDPTTLEVVINRGHSVNDLFQWLTEHRITIASMRNKSSRLEELFVRMVRDND